MLSSRIQTTHNIFIALLFFILPLDISLAAESSFGFDRISIEDGLPHYSVISMFQDRQGFLWIGTVKGLARYDGYSFKTFVHNPEERISISSSAISAITEDRQGGIWVGTWGGGVNRFNPETETFQHYLHDANNPQSLSHNTVRAITIDNQGNLWVGTSSGLNRFNPETETFQHYLHDANNPNSLSHDHVRTITEDIQGNLWIGTSSGLNRFNPEKETFQHYLHDANNPNSLSHDHIRSITADREGNLWVGTLGGGLNRFDPHTEIFHHYRHDANNPNSLSDDNVMTITEDRQGNLWVGTMDYGINRFNSETKTFQHYLYNANNPRSLSDDTVFSISKDRQGGIWVGTRRGLNRLHPQTKTFQHYRHDPNNPNSLSHTGVFAITEDRQGSIWIGTRAGGLNRFNLETETFQHYRHDANNPNSLSHDYVRSIAVDSQGELWVGTWDEGLNRFNPQTETFQHYTHDANNPHSLSDNRVTSITEDSLGNLWVGTWGGGLNRFNPETETFQHYRHDANNPNSLSHDMVFSISEDRQGHLWVGTRHGLNRFNPETETFQHYLHDANNPNSLSDDNVMTITEDRQGGIWVGTSDGLNLLDKQSNTFKRFDLMNNESIYNIEEDNQGQLWLSSNYSLSRLNPKTGGFKKYDEGNGLQGDEFVLGSSLKSHTGEMYFGDSSGFHRFSPLKITDDLEPPKVTFTDLLISNQSVAIGINSNNTSSFENVFTLDKAIHSTKILTLNHQQNMVTFEFSTLHFTNPKKHQYAYKLEGFDKQWIKTDHKNRRATYTNLPAGEYIIRVKASNGDGVWNEKGASLKITVLPPFWKTWWAYSFYYLILISLIWWFVRTQRKKVQFEREINQQLEQKVAERTSELEKVSLTDQLTGAHNRRFLDKFIDKEIAKINRAYFEHKENASPKLGFIMLDMDHFKQVNDVHGHDAGDKVLVQLVKIITDTCRLSDWVVRWGGEEFVVVANAVNLQEIQNLAERIRVNIEAHSFDIGNGKTLMKTCSIGITSYPFVEKKPEAFSWEQTLNIADIALYAVKNNGRNAWISLFEKDVTNVEQLSLEMAELIDTQIKEGHLSYETSFQKEVEWI